MPQLVVAGTLTLDTLHDADGRVVHRGVGGLLYNLVALSAMLGDRARLVPVAHVGANGWERITSALSMLPGVVLDGLIRVEAPNNHVRLWNRSGGGRDEILTGLVPPLDAADLAPHLADADALLVNWISGFDFTDRAVAHLAAAPIPLKLLDLHSRTLALLPDGRRAPQPVADGSRLTAGFGTVQLNETECWALLPDGERPDSAAEVSDIAARSVARRVLAAGTESVILTRGERGAVLVTSSGDWTVPTPDLGPALDPTGCGDTLSGAYLAARILGRDPLEALRQAVQSASLKATVSGAEAALAALRRR